MKATNYSYKCYPPTPFHLDSLKDETEPFLEVEQPEKGFRSLLANIRKTERKESPVEEIVLRKSRSAYS